MIPKTIWRVIDSDDGMALLDTTEARGGDWGAGGCAILAFALQEVLEGSEVVVIFHCDKDRVEHFGACLRRGEIVDAAGVYSGALDWLQDFSKESGIELDKLRVFGYDTDMNTNEIVIDTAASHRLAEMIRS